MTDETAPGLPNSETMAINESPTLIASDKVQGTAIYDDSGARLGVVEHVMLNKFEGRVAYVVVSFGGILGVGTEFHPVPWDRSATDQVDYEAELGVIVGQGGKNIPRAQALNAKSATAGPIA